MLVINLTPQTSPDRNRPNDIFMCPFILCMCTCAHTHNTHTHTNTHITHQHTKKNTYIWMECQHHMALCVHSLAKSDTIYLIC